jgi:hypothetical protein
LKRYGPWLGWFNIATAGHRFDKGEGVAKLRIDLGPWYRGYLSMMGSITVLILTAGDKGSQKRDIVNAKRHWQDYQQRRIGNSNPHSARRTVVRIGRARAFPAGAGRAPVGFAQTLPVCRFWQQAQSPPHHFDLAAGFQPGLRRLANIRRSFKK